MRLVLDAGLAALGVALLVGIAWTVYSAVTDRSIVVNAFTVAPNLEKSGTSVDSLFVNVDELRLDVPLMIREALMDYDATSGLGSTGFPAGAVIAQYYGLQHDPAAAELLLETNPDAAGEQQSILGASAPIEEAAARGMVEFEAGQPHPVIRQSRLQCRSCLSGAA